MLRISKNHPWPCFLLPVVCLLLLGWTAVPCDAQEATPVGGKQYKQLPINNNLRSHRSAILKSLSRTLSQEQKKRVKLFYNDFFFPQWTQPEQLNDLPSLRTSLEGAFAKATNSQAYEALRTIALDNLKPMATSSEFHPAVRFNAALMIGRLDAAKRTSSRKFAQPYPGALDVLIPLIENQDENDAARFGAMLGIVRHAQFSRDAASRPKVIKVLIAQADNSQLPPNQTLSEGQQWFRATAVENLAYATGDEVNTVAPVLAKVINDKTEPDTLRRVAAEAIGNLKLTPKSGANPVVTIRSLAELAADAVRKEVEACEKDVTRTIAPDLLLNQLVPIRVALSGSEKHVPAPNGGLAPVIEDKEFLKKTYKLVDDWCLDLDNKELLPEDMMQTDPIMSGEKSPARVATEKLIEKLKLDLQKMDNLLGVGGNPAG